MSDVIVPWESIANYGVLGIVLLWFMFRMEKVIQANTSAIDALSIANTKALDTLSDLVRKLT